MTGRYRTIALLILAALLGTLLFVRVRGGEWNPGLIVLIMLVAVGRFWPQRTRS